MPSPWEQKWNEVKKEVGGMVEDTSETLQNALPWARDWKAKATPQQTPVASPEPVKQLPNDPDGFWTSFQQKWKENAPKVQAEISAMKQKEFGAELPDAIKNLEKALSGKGLDGTVRRILRTEYKDLTGKEFNSRNKDIKPLSNVDRRVLPASKVGDVFDAASEFAQAAGEKVQDVALAAGAGVGTSSALATAGEMLADPLNLIPGGKGVAAAGVLFKTGDRILSKEGKMGIITSIREQVSSKGQEAYLKKLDELHNQAFQGYSAGQHTFQQATEIYDALVKKHEKQLRAIYKNPTDKEIIQVPKVLFEGETRPKSMFGSEIEKHFSGPNTIVGAGEAVNSSFIPSKYVKTPYDPKTGYSSQLNNPIYLSEDAPPGLAGARLSGFTDANNKYFHGYDKNGEKFTIEASKVNPDWITSSKDSNKTAEYFRDRLKGK